MYSKTMSAALILGTVVAGVAATPPLPADAAPAARAASPASVVATAGGGVTRAAAGPAVRIRGRAKLLPARRSRLPWASGVYVPTDIPQDYEDFGTWRGAAPDVALTYTYRGNWDEIIRMPRVYERWSDLPPNLTLVISVAMIPDTGATLVECARGAYDAKWRAFGRGLAAAGLADRTVIRLGWEFNGLWVPWAARKPKHYAACWRHIHRSAEIAAPELLWDWCVNRGISSVGIDPRKSYPGDRFVDIIGVDSFDGYPPATTDAGWKEQAESKFGLQFWADYARRHRKGFSVPEWAVYSGRDWGRNAGGDNRRYIARMFSFFRRNADVLTYETYFNESDPYAATAVEVNPRAAKEYRRQFTLTQRRHLCQGCALPHG
jgi:hypothetical protein